MADTMNDRELLEAAAEAAGMKVTGWNTQQGEEVAVLDDGSFWQPLHMNRITNADGDAFRLAVKLGIQIRQYPIYDTPRFAAYACEPKWDSDAQKNIGAEALVQYDGDQYAATRRAIVRTAAALTRMESKE